MIGSIKNVLIQKSHWQWLISSSQTRKMDSHYMGMSTYYLRWDDALHWWIHPTTTRSFLLFEEKKNYKIFPSCLLSFYLVQESASAWS
jgi:hypothetical protein